MANRDKYWDDIFNKLDWKAAGNKNVVINYLGKLYKIPIVNGPKIADLSDFHTYLSAYFRFEGWQPWQNLSLAYAPEEEEEYHGTKALSNSNFETVMQNYSTFFASQIAEDRIQDNKHIVDQMLEENKKMGKK